MDLKNAIIPWSEFLDALGQQQPAQLQLWLLRWRFSDSGALLAELGSPARFPKLRWAPEIARKSFAHTSAE